MRFKKIPKKLQSPKTKADLSKLYDTLFQAGVEVFSSFNICNHTPTGKTYRMSCLNRMTNRKVVNTISCSSCKQYKDGTGYCCCGGCAYLLQKGCRIKCLWCKLWLCYRWDEGLKKKDVRQITKRIRYLRGIAEEHDLLHYRSPKWYAIKRGWETCKSK